MTDTHTAWFAALRAGDLATIDTMLAADASLAEARHGSGLSSVMWACYCRQLAAATRLRDAGATLDLFEAVAAGDEDRARALLAADPALARAWSSDRFTALHLAAFFARPALVEHLLALGADANAVARNDARVQPLHSAAAAGDEASVRLLLAHGAAVDARQAHEYTALMAAAQSGNAALAERLLAHGADPLARADDGRAAADFADERGHHALAARLRAGSPDR